MHGCHIFLQFPISKSLRSQSAFSKNEFRMSIEILIIRPKEILPMKTPPLH